MDNKISYERYQRQIILKEFGEAGQQKLLNAKVLVVGAGGLGCPALQYLAAAGIGTIGIVDDDVVMLNNLQRQILFSVNDIGKSKAERATFILQQLNPEINIIPFNQRLIAQNALEIINGFDYVVDGTDNFASRYMINDACVLLNKPLIYGAVSKFEGQVAIFNCKKNEEDKAVNYRDLFPKPLKDDEVLNCAEAGVTGVLTGIIGVMMANEVIKLVAGIGKPLINNLFIFNALNNQTYQLELVAKNETLSLIPENEKVFRQTDYEWLCQSSSDDLEIDMDDFDKFIHQKNIDIIDVREFVEIPVISEFERLQIPFGEIEKNISLIKNNTVVLFCQTGKRSLKAAKMLSAIFQHTKKIYSLKGGIIQWHNTQNKKHE